MVRHLPFLEQIATAYEDEWEEIAPVFLTLRLFDDWLMWVVLSDEASPELMEVSQAAVRLEQDLSSHNQGAKEGFKQGVKEDCKKGVKEGVIASRTGRILRGISTGGYTAVPAIVCELSDLAREDLSGKYPGLSYDIYANIGRLEEYTVHGCPISTSTSSGKSERLRELLRTATLYSTASRAEMEGQYMKALLHYHATYTMTDELFVRSAALKGIVRCSERLNYPALSSVASHLLSQTFAHYDYSPDAANPAMTEEIAQVMDDLAASSFNKVL